MIKVEDLISEIESLPIDIKTDIINRLLNSINPSQKEIDNLWAEEAERRVNEIKSGKVKTIPGDEFFAEIQDKFSKLCKLSESKWRKKNENHFTVR